MAEDLVEKYPVVWTTGDANGMDRADKGANSTWFKEVDYSVRPTWQQLFALGVNSFDWLNRDSYAKDYCFTNPQDGTAPSCLVATLCYHAGPGEYKVIQSTIPRGQWRRRVLKCGKEVAPEWFAAATNGGAHAPRGCHAEDSALYYCEQTYNGRCLTPRPGREPIRIVVYGIKGGSGAEPKKALLCPNCQLIAGRLSVKYLHSTNTIASLDAQDAQPQQQQQQQQQQQPPRSSGSGNRYSGDSIWEDAELDPATGNLIASDRTRRPAQDTSQHQGLQSRPGGAYSSNSLIERMSRLSLDRRDSRSSGSTRPGGPQQGRPSVQAGGFQVPPPRDPARQQVGRPEAQPRASQGTGRLPPSQSAASDTQRSVARGPARLSSPAQPTARDSRPASSQSPARNSRTPAGRDPRRE